MDLDGSNPKEFHRMLSDVQSKIEKLVAFSTPSEKFLDNYSVKGWNGVEVTEDPEARDFEKPQQNLL